MLLPSLLAGLLASLACGIIGPYVITRRIVFLSGAIAHIALGGIGAAIFLQWLSPIYGAAIAALLGAVIIGVVHDRIKERMDTVIGAMWAVGMASGAEPCCVIRRTQSEPTRRSARMFLRSAASADEESATTQTSAGWST